MQLLHNGMSVQHRIMIVRIIEYPDAVCAGVRLKCHSKRSPRKIS